MRRRQDQELLLRKHVDGRGLFRNKLLRYVLADEDLVDLTFGDGAPPRASRALRLLAVQVLEPFRNLGVAVAPSFGGSFVREPAVVKIDVHRPLEDVDAPAAGGGGGKNFQALAAEVRRISEKVRMILAQTPVSGGPGGFLKL